MRFGIAVAFLGLTGAAAGQVQIAGPLSDSTTGPLLAGVVYHATGPISVPAGERLTAQPGAIVKMVPTTGDFAVDGTLIADGTSTAPVIFTVLYDDSAGGDTNGDGSATMPSPGLWRGLAFGPASDRSSLTWTEVRYAGESSVPGVQLDQADISLLSCTIRDCARDGLSTGYAPPLVPTSAPSVRNTSFLDNGGFAVTADIDAVPGFSYNHASGHGSWPFGGDFILVTSGVAQRDLVIEEHNCLGGALVMGDPLFVREQESLRIERGVVIKRASTWFVTFWGGIEINGTVDDPVVFTSLEDDEHGGDTNGDGAATQPAPGDWESLSVVDPLSAPPSTAVLRNVLVRYAGWGGAAVQVASSLATLENVRSDHSSWDGVLLREFASVSGITAWQAQRNGISLEGDFDASDLTAAGCVGAGITRLDPGLPPFLPPVITHTGVLRSVVAWGNGGEDIVGFDGTADLQFSNGEPSLAGTLGNIHADPLFVDEAAGDLRLTAGSPCVDTGDPATHDPDCTRSDMGALPLDQGAPSTYCTAKANSQGCLPFASFTGSASASSALPFLIAGNDLVNNRRGLFLYSLDGPASHPFGGGVICIAPPRIATPMQGTGGNPPPDDCSGTLAIDFNARIQSGAHAALFPGVDVHGQFAVRDPGASFGLGLTDGVTFVICP